MRRTILTGFGLAGLVVLSGCASLNDTERAFIGGGVGLALAGPVGVAAGVGATAGAATGLFADNVLGY